MGYGLCQASTIFDIVFPCQTVFSENAKYLRRRPFCANYITVLFLVMNPALIHQGDGAQACPRVAPYSIAVDPIAVDPIAADPIARYSIRISPRCRHAHFTYDAASFFGINFQRQIRQSFLLGRPGRF